MVGITVAFILAVQAVTLSRSPAAVWTVSLVLVTLAPPGCGEPAGDATGGGSRAAIESGLRRAVIFEGEDSTFTLADRMRHHRVPGLSFALIEDGEIAWSAGYGIRRQGGSDSVNAATLFQAASISKPVAAAAALRMRDSGLVELDAGVEEYLDRYELPEGAQSASRPVTLRHLLAHTAGTTPGGYRGYLAGSPVPTDVQVAQGVSPANSPPVRVESPPGERLAYSGGGYTIVEIAMQDVTGRPFEELMEEWMLTDAGMRHSTFSQPLPAGLHGRAARGHRGDGSVLEGGWRVHPEQAAAGLWSTAHDLARFAVELRRAYRGESDLLARTSAREMLTEVREDHGLGVVLMGDGDERAFAHAGGNEGYRAYMILYLGTGDGAVFMTNSDSGMVLGQELLRAASAVQGWPHYRPDRYERVSVSPDSLRVLEGRYRFGQGVSVELALREEGERLTVTFPNGDTYALVPVGAGRFVHPRTGTTVGFGWEHGRRAVVIYGDRGVRVDR